LNEVELVNLVEVKHIDISLPKNKVVSIKEEDSPNKVVIKTSLKIY